MTCLEISNHLCLEKHLKSSEIDIKQALKSYNNSDKGDLFPGIHILY